MSNLKIGDKVKFLNASGGGVVAKLIDSRTVSVLIEDGFEIPTMISELIRIDSDAPAARFFDNHFKTELPVIPEPEAEPADDRLRELPGNLRRTRNSEDIYLAFVPHDQKWMITGMVDIILINNTSYDVLYNIFSKTSIGHFNGVDYGNVFPDSTLMIDTINREQLTHWTEGCFQFLFHTPQSHFVLPPFNSDFRIEGKRFFKEGNYRTHPMIEGKGIVLKLLSVSDYIRETGPVTGEHTPAEGVASKEPLPLIVKHQTAPLEAVIDLHIHELIDDPVNLEKSEIMEFQTDYFMKCLDSARAQRFRKITFIHGVGNGVLKERITRILSKTEGIEFFDAPMAQFGVGAVEVRLLQNG